MYLCNRILQNTSKAKLTERFATLMRGISLEFKMYLYDSFDWNDRLIAIKGSRGVGKTTLILQYIRENFKIDSTALHISLEDIYLQANS